MSNALTAISEATFLINFMALLYVLSLKRERTSFEVILFLSLILTGIHVWYETKLLYLMSVGEYEDLIIHIWYLGFAFSDFVFVGVILAYSKFKELERDVISDSILACFVILGFIQLARYVDRVIIGSDVLGLLYKNSIPAINTIMTILVLSYVFRSLWSLLEFKVKALLAERAEREAK